LKELDIGQQIVTSIYSQSSRQLFRLARLEARSERISAENKAESVNHASSRLWAHQKCPRKTVTFPLLILALAVPPCLHP
jgi:hypothetical protein